ncbi:MAG TPA: AraC family transcriptional regulator [Flavisolibacter sp.]|nr:AraC family transcriptional regulator [Flavisolibacter sp.]
MRCKMAVQAVMEKAGVDYLSIELGWAKLKEGLTSEQKAAVQEELSRYQLEIMEDKTAILLERIKTEITRILHSPEPPRFKLSAHLSQALNYNYTYLANTFSEHEGMTLERYFIAQRVERVKELIIYEDFSLNRIMNQLAYSSLSHLCLQFKKTSGLTPAEFRRQSRTENFIWREVK